MVLVRNGSMAIYSYYPVPIKASLLYPVLARVPTRPYGETDGPGQSVWSGIEVSVYCTVVIVVCSFSRLYINICIKYGYCILIIGCSIWWSSRTEGDEFNLSGPGQPPGSATEYLLLVTHSLSRSRMGGKPRVPALVCGLVA